MNVLLVCRHDMFWGGVGEVIRNLAIRLPQHGVRPVLACSHSTVIRFGKESGLVAQHVRLPRGRLGHPFRWAADVRVLQELCRSHSIDLCHAHALHSTVVAARAIKKRLALPYVVTSHGDAVPQAVEALSRSRLHRIRQGLVEADAVTHLTRAMEQFSHQIVDTTGRDSVIPNGCDLAWWRLGLSRCMEQRRRYFIVLSRLVDDKGLEILVDAFARAVQSGCEASLALAGDGPREVSLRSQAKRLGLVIVDGLERLDAGCGPAICFCGYLNGEEKRRALLEALFLVHPTPEREGFPLALVEAVAAGKCVVSFDLPTYRDILVPGCNSRILPRVDVDLLADSISELARDGAARLACESFNRSWAEQFDWDVITRRYVEVYQGVLDQRGSRGRPHHEG